MTHARIAPSAMALTVKCHASVQLQEQVPPLPETEEEAEGTFAHWVAMKYAQGHEHSMPVGSKFMYNGREWTIDIDMVAGAEMYKRAIGGFHSSLRLEDAVRASRIHPEHCWGTPDAWRFFPDARNAWLECPPEISPVLFAQGVVKILRIGDYKFGHRYVEVYGNYQTTAYAVGVMERLDLDDLDPNLWIEMCIIQPRCYQAEGPVRWWRVQASALRAYVNIASSAAHAALGENPVATTNDSCIDCRARHVCKTLQYATGALVDFSTSAELVEMPHDAIGTELAMVQDAIQRLKARETGLAAQAEALMRQGKPISFFHMTPGQSRLTYFDDVNIDEVVSLGELMGVDLRKPPDRKDLLVTPTQAIQRGIDEKTMSAYAHRPRAALKLTRDDSTTARKVFNR
jgi:hypothetical protein